MIDRTKIRAYLLDLLAIPSPCGFTDEIVRYLCDVLTELDIDYELTRRGTIRAKLPGKSSETARAIVTHVDSIGAMVRNLRDDGRVSVAPIGYWSSRFAEGARVTVFGEQQSFRGTLLPSIEWGVSRDKGVADVAMNWDNIELRIDEPVYSAQDLKDAGIGIGDFIALDSTPEVMDNGYIVGRMLDNKAGIAAVLETLATLKTSEEAVEHDTYIIFTVAETIGTGAGSALPRDVSELVTVDFAALRSTEKSPFKQVTLAAGDASGPYDYHLNAHLRQLAEQHDIPFVKRMLKAFHSDAAAVLAAGHDVRTAVLAYAGDASHSLERTHMDSLVNISNLLARYITSAPTFEQDASLTTVDKFSRQITEQNQPQPLPPTPDFAEVVKRDKRKKTRMAKSTKKRNK